jgi:hypothetical protein
MKSELYLCFIRKKLHRPDRSRFFSPLISDLYYPC